MAYVIFNLNLFIEVHNNNIIQKASTVCTTRHFHPSLTFLSKVRASSVELK